MVHVTINARTDADIDEDDIVKKVAKSSGANYSFHKEKAKPIDAPAPVVSYSSCHNLSSAFLISCSNLCHKKILLHNFFNYT